MRIKVGEDIQADKELGIYIDGHVENSYLRHNESGIWTIRPPIRSYPKDYHPAPKDMVHPTARLLSEGRPIIFDKDFKKMFVRGFEKDAIAQ